MFKILIIFFVVICRLDSFAQNSINSSGNNAQSGGGKVSYSVGQIFFDYNIATNGSVAHGIQQPYEISDITSIEFKKDEINSVKIFPNPTSDNITLRVDAYEYQNIKYQLFNLKGKLLIDEDVKGNETNISMSNLSPSTYLLKVIQDDKEISTFKIIKRK